MKFSAVTVIFSLLAISSALPHQPEKKHALPELESLVRRQSSVPVEVPSMKVNGEVVPFTAGGPKGAGKRSVEPVRRQSSVPVEVPSMKVNGEVVPFSAGGPKANGGN